MTATVLERDSDGHQSRGSGRIGPSRAWLGRARAIAGGSLHPPIATAALIAAVVASAVHFHVFQHELDLEPTYQWGFSGSGLLAGGWTTLASSQFLTRDVFMAVSIPMSLVVMLGSYEALRGTTRTVIVAVTSALAGPGLVTAGLGVGSALQIEFASRTLETLDYGASAMTAGGAGALVAVVRNRWLNRGAVAFVMSGLVVHHELADWEHFVAFPVGFALGRLLDLWHPIARRRAGTERRPSTRGSRVLAVAVIVAASACGWTIASSAFSTNAQAAVQVAATAAPTAGPGTMPTTATGPPSPARIVDVRYPTPSLGGERRVLILLPAGYDSGTSRYPVIEMLHGRPGGPDDIFTGLGILTIAPTVAPFIAVVPDGHGPVVSDGDFADTSKQHLGAALGEDLQRWVDATYRTSRWSVMGLSAGGFGAAYLATRPAAHYDAVCALSGNFVAQEPPFAGESTAVRDAASPIKHVAANGPRTMLVYGKQDAESVTEAQAYAAAMAKIGQPHDTVALDGGHDWSFFLAGAPSCLGFLLRN